MGNGLDCCVRREKEGHPESATDYFDKCCVPRVPRLPSGHIQMPIETAPSGEFIADPPDSVRNPPDSVRNIDDMGPSALAVPRPSALAAPVGTTVTEDLEVATPRCFLVTPRYPPTTTIPYDSTMTIPEKETLISEVDNEPAEEMVQFPPHTTVQHSLVEYHSMMSWYGSAEAPDSLFDEDKEKLDENAQFARLTSHKSLKDWYANNCSSDFSAEQHSPARDGEASREAVTSATLFYNMSFNQSMSAIDDETTRAALGKFGSFAMSAPAYPPMRGTNSNLPLVD